MARRREAEQRLQNMTTAFIEKIRPALFAPVSMQQFVTTKDNPAKGPMWVSRTTFPAPVDCEGLKGAVRSAIDDLTNTEENKVGDFEIEDVKVQWTGSRPSGPEKEREPNISEREKYEGMMRDVKSDIVVLYAHGGFYYTGSPASVRGITSSLARETGGRCLVPDYRLAPQNPFPSAVVDLLISYLSLLYPGEDALHMAVSPQNIVFAGDSSGGNLVLSLLSLIQQIRSQPIQFRGKSITIPLPAGIATLSPHCDHTNSFDSHTRNKPYDIFILDALPHLQPNFPSCDLWPTSPPREDIYCHAHTLTHPLVSVAIAPAWSAAYMPPMFFATGQEKLTDEAYFLAGRAAVAGTTVQFAQYDALPHNFAYFFPKLPQSRDVLKRFGAFCREVVKNSGGVKSGFVRYAADDDKFQGEKLVIDVSMDEQERERKMKEKVVGRKPWTGTKEMAML